MGLQMYTGKSSPKWVKGARRKCESKGEITMASIHHEPSSRLSRRGTVGDFVT